MKIYPGDFSIEVLKIFNEDLFIGDFFLKNFVEIFPLNIFNKGLFVGDFSWRFSF